MKSRVLIAGGVALLAGLGLAWFFASFERVPYKERIGPSNEARLRPFLAAERFAEAMEVESDEVRSLPELDSLPAGAVLVLPAQRQALESKRMNQLAAWVGRGGHLVVEAEYLGVPDPLLDLLGVTRNPIEAGSGKPLLVDVGGGRPLAVVLPTRMGLKAEQAGKLLVRAGPPDAAQLVSYRRGAGFVTVAVSLDFARNQRIGQHDHAELLWQLINLNPAAPSLLVFNRPERLSLWGFLAEHAAEALGASLALLALWLWRIAPRFGPVAPDAPPARRRLLDHLRASGRYYWALDLRERLLVAARDAALRRVLRAQPEFAAAQPQERAPRLAALVGVSAAEAQRLLDAGGAIRGAAFIEVMRTAQRVHAALERGNR
jgi:hypothetical protein